MTTPPPEPRVLLVEDDPATARALGAGLARAGLRVRAAGSGREAVALARSEPPDVILLDLGLPDMGGDEVLRRLRAQSTDTPVLVLSADGSPVRKAESLRHGADDHLAKPADRDELVARIRAVMRRARAPAAPPVRVGSLEIDLAARQARAAGTPLSLTDKEYRVLELLARRRGQAVSKAALHAHLYGEGPGPEARIVDVFLCRLRRKIADATGGEAPIETVWGAGLRLAEPRRRD